MTKEKEYDMIIIGGGCVGFGAAVYAGRFRLKTLVIGKEMGGTIILTNDVENYPGFEKLSGQDLFENIKKHALNYDIDTVEKEVKGVKKGPGKMYTVSVKDDEYITKTVLFSTGTEWRKLGVPGEAEYTSKGVHYCAMCDGAFYKDKVIGVIGGSDSAAKEALMLAEWAKKVYIIYRKERIRAEPINAKRVDENPKIEIIPNTNVVEIKGEQFVNKVIFDNEYKGNKEFALDGLFVEIGHIALSSLAKDLGVKLDKRGEIIIDRKSQTNLPGVYAAGDVADTEFKQAITGVAEGVHATYQAYQYINNTDF